jgi:uncharacterized SAM-binding protein YcdF (DUF218 family)
VIDDRPTAHQAPARGSPLGADGVLTLLLSSLVLAGTGALSLLPPLYRVTAIARRTPTIRHDPAIVAVFGNRLSDEGPDPEYLERLERARALYLGGGVERILLLGGVTGHARISEAGAGAAYLERRGVPPQCLWQEDNSRHTLENLAHARDLLVNAPQPPVFVTSRYHLARCATIAAGFGLQHRLCAAEERLAWSPGLLLRIAGEGFYLHWYWVGKTWSYLTRNHKSLARIR